MRIEPRRDRLERRQIDMIINMREHLIVGRHRRATDAMLGKDIASYPGLSPCRTPAREESLYRFFTSLR